MGLFNPAVMNLDSRDKLYGIKFELFLLLARQLWASYSTSLSLIFLDCTIKIILVSLHRFVLRVIHKISTTTSGMK